MDWLLVIVEVSVLALFLFKLCLDLEYKCMERVYYTLSALGLLYAIYRELMIAFVRIPVSNLRLTDAIGYGCCLLSLYVFLIVVIYRAEYQSLCVRTIMHCMCVLSFICFIIQECMDVIAAINTNETANVSIKGYVHLQMQLYMLVAMTLLACAKCGGWQCYLWLYVLCMSVDCGAYGYTLLRDPTTLAPYLAIFDAVVYSLPLLNVLFGTPQISVPESNPASVSEPRKELQEHLLPAPPHNS